MKEREGRRLRDSDSDCEADLAVGIQTRKAGKEEIPNQGTSRTRRRPQAERETPRTRVEKRIKKFGRNLIKNGL